MSRPLTSVRSRSPAALLMLKPCVCWQQRRIVGNAPAFIQREIFRSNNRKNRWPDRLPAYPKRAVPQFPVPCNKASQRRGDHAEVDTARLHQNSASKECVSVEATHHPLASRVGMHPLGGACTPTFTSEALSRSQSKPRRNLAKCRPGNSCDWLTASVQPPGLCSLQERLLCDVFELHRTPFRSPLADTLSLADTS